MKIVEFANSLDPDGVTLNEPSDLDLHVLSLPASIWNYPMI